MNIYRTFIIFGMLSLLTNCGGGSSAPTSPVQVPTEISFANENEYGGGVVIPLAKSITATSDADFTSGEVVFTDSSTGEEDTTGVCGTASVDGETITLTGPDSWPNATSQCSVSFLYDDSAIPVQVASASISPIGKNIAKADSDSTSLTAYYDTSDTVLEGSGLAITSATLQENAIVPTVSAYGGYVHACWLTLAKSGTNQSTANYNTNKMVYSRSADNGATWTDPVTIADLGSVTVPVTNATYGLAERCQIKAGEDSAGNGLIAIVEKYKNSAATAQKNLVLKLSRDNGDTWSSGATVVENTAMNDRVAILINSDAVHIAYNAAASKHIVPCTVSGSTATCGSDYTIAGASSNYDDEVNLAAYGSNIYAIYTDNSYSAGNIYNDVVIKALSYSDGYTLTNTYQLTSAEAGTGNALYPFIAADNSGRLVATYSYDNVYNAVVAIVDTSTGDITRGQVNDADLGETPHLVKPFVSAANHYHFFYGLIVNTYQGYYRMCDSELICADAVPIDILALPNIEGLEVDRAGRVYLPASPYEGENDLYQSGSVLLGRFTLGSL
ncbi:MAG: exo-alpha-sialidase [Deltaproteobacteria bacterium]|nr:exo-alpha-sialidase [Deltaproteobacteria bacterium]